ncbi:MAG: response regulator [Deltaproteobacteria bacterium]|nr:response regulator [Deltaproteobacteria bacterium]
MAKGRVLVIDGDEWVARLLAAGLRDYGFDVSTSVSGQGGLEVARAIEPDCIITEAALADLEGAAIVKTLRAEESAISLTPVVFLTNADDGASRLAAFHAGCDVYLTKPFRVEEIAMQVQALVTMATRYRGRRESPSISDSEHSPESTVPGGHAIEGNIAQMSVATVLTLLEMEHRTGVLSITGKGRKCSLEMVGGFACAGTIGGSKVSPLAVLRQILCWKEGRFRFRPGTDTALPTNRRSIGALLIEAVRLDDESAMDRTGSEEEETPTARKQAPIGLSSSPPPSRRATPGLPRRLSRPPPPPPPNKPPPSANKQVPAAKRASRPPPPGAAPAAAVPRPPPLPALRPAQRTGSGTPGITDKKS